jgi:hypothetical protein
VALSPIGPHTASPHLIELVAEAERLAARCADAAPEARGALGAERRTLAALASLQLDGSPIDAVPDPGVIAEAHATVAAAPPPADDLGDGGPRPGTWFDAMRAFDAPDPDDPEAVAHDAAILALEYDGVVRADRADHLATALLTDPVPTLTALHAELTRHLVAPARVGRPRVAEQAVHDASVGRILYFTTPPERIADELAELGAWLVSAGTREHGLVVAGIAHLELLRIHPFDAANGRLARTVARLLLRARGLDPDGLGAPDTVLDRDRLGYHDEVARTLRRRDPTVWLERWGEAVTEGLRAAARTLGQLGDDLPDRAQAFLATRGPGEAFTVADHRAGSATAPEESRADLRAMLDAGRILRVPGSRGLRFTVAG